MLIECKIKRTNGTNAEIGGIVYKFQPNSEGAHVADVEEEAHIARFLEISEGYKIYRPAQVADEQKAKPKEKNAAESLAGSNVHPASFEINGKAYALGDIVAAAHTKSGLSVEDWNGLSEDARADLIDDELDALKADTNGGGNVDAAEELVKLKADYTSKFGKAPHHSMKAETIKARLAE